MANSADIYLPADEIEKHFIISIWRIQDDTAHERVETILPKGTVEIIFNLSDNITYVKPSLDYHTRLPCCFINGINFKPFKLVKSGRQIFLGIQLNTIGLKGLLGVNVSEFNDSVAEGAQVCKSLKALCAQLFVKKTFNEQVKTIRAWLRLKISGSKYLQKIEQARGLFYSHPLNAHATVKELCMEKCISDRQMRRLSAEWLGMNTETFLLYNKYLASLHLLHRSGLSLTQIGSEAGYYDQSHFIREFKSFTGLTPKAYQTAATGLPGHIIG